MDCVSLTKIWNKINVKQKYDSSELFFNLTREMKQGFCLFMSGELEGLFTFCLIILKGQVLNIAFSKFDKWSGINNAIFVIQESLLQIWKNRITKLLKNSKTLTALKITLLN